MARRTRAITCPAFRGAERAELAALIDAYLARAPRQAFDQAAFRGSSAERTVDELERAIAGQAGLWPALLPRLRDRAGLKRSHLVERLAAALGVQGPRGQGRRLLPPDGAGAPSGRGRLGPGARGARAASSARPRRRSAKPDARFAPPSEGPAAAPAAAFARRAYAEAAGPPRRGAAAARRGRVGRGRRAVPRRLTSGSRVQTTLPMIDMRDAHDPAALVRHAAAGGRLAARRADHADARAATPARPATTAQRAYATLVLKLGLAGETGDYHRALMEEIERPSRGVPRSHPELHMGRLEPPSSDRGDRG